MQKRIEFLDLAKGICIILVVLFHMTKYYHVEMPAADFFKAFRLPLYFFLSGLFFKTYSGFSDFVVRKVNKLLIPFVFWYLLLSVSVPYFSFHLLGINFFDKGMNITLMDCLSNFFNKESFPNAPIWFLLCLFEVNIIFYIIMLIAKSFFNDSTWSICMMALLFGIFGICLSFVGCDLPMYLDSALSALPFFVFGFYINRRTSFLEKHSWDRYNIPIAIMLFAVVFVFASHYSLKYNTYPSHLDAVQMYPCGFMGTIAIILIAKTLKYVPIITYLGRYSIMILVTHVMVLKIFALIVAKFGLSDSWECIINLILTLLSYLLIIPFMKKYMPHVTAQKDVIPVR
jgi:fucose 4-O-acetylase-like acetyltransferase